VSKFRPNYQVKKHCIYCGCDLKGSGSICLACKTDWADEIAESNNEKMDRLLAQLEDEE